MKYLSVAGALLGLVCFLLSGCSRDPDPVGEWNDRGTAAMSRGGPRQAELRLSLKEDGTGSMFIGHDIPFTWEREGRALTFQRQFRGRNRTWCQAELSEDGQRMKVKQPARDGSITDLDFFKVEE